MSGVGIIRGTEFCDTYLKIQDFLCVLVNGGENKKFKSFFYLCLNNVMNETKYWRKASVGKNECLLNVEGINLRLQPNI